MLYAPAWRTAVMAWHVRLTLIVIGPWLVAQSAAAAPPQITRITAPALKISSTTTLVIDGTNLAPNPRIVLPLPIASQTLKGSATASRVQVEVKLDKVAPGVYPLRIASDQGILQPGGRCRGRVAAAAVWAGSGRNAGGPERQPGRQCGPFDDGYREKGPAPGDRSRSATIGLGHRSRGQAARCPANPAGLDARPQYPRRRRPAHRRSAGGWDLHHSIARFAIPGRFAQRLPSETRRFAVRRPPLSACRPAGDRPVVRDHRQPGAKPASQGRPERGFGRLLFPPSAAARSTRPGPASWSATFRNSSRPTSRRASSRRSR